MSDPAWRELGVVGDDETVEITLVLSSLAAPQRDAKRRALVDAIAANPRERQPETIKELLGASESVLQACSALASKYGLTYSVKRELPAEVALAGTAPQMRAALGISYKWVEFNGRKSLARVADVRMQLPDDLAPYVVDVLGLDDHRPGGFTPFRSGGALLRDAKDTPASPVAPPAASAETRFLTARDLAAFYDFPEGQGLDGSGVTVGFIVLAGGLDLEGLAPNFTCLGLETPDVKIIELDNAKNTPVGPEAIKAYIVGQGIGQAGAPLACEQPQARRWQRPAPDPNATNITEAMWGTLEIMMDVALFGALANGAKIRVYRSKPNRSGMRDAILEAADDGVSILVLTGGDAEGDLHPNWGLDQNGTAGVDAALDYAIGARGVTVLCSSGDRGSTASSVDGEQHKLQPAYPASHDLVVACGGTQIVWTDESTPTEVVWNEHILGDRLASSGGFSKIFQRPAWQAGLPGEMRAVPDIAANAAFASGLWNWLGSVNATSLGTSAAAPILAALMARIYQGLGIQGGIPGLAALLYQPAARAAMAPITQGHNGVQVGVTEYSAGPGWNPCTGLGRPIGAQLMEALKP
ncbi:S53 family peptidase [Sorangium sp. So ce887]|uniref:S53 family peptidase n=1 Tax=Sorangium sp. So ce887 TaxID=3133324 RepID=UPI003F5E3514